VYAYGGAVFVAVGAGAPSGSGSTVAIVGSTVAGNKLHCGGSGSCGGGAVYVDIGSSTNADSALTVASSTFADNVVQGM
jgi:hypothetical protein